MKKRLSLLMVLMMVLSLVPMSVFAASGSMTGGVLSFDDTDENATAEDFSVKLTQGAFSDIKGGGKVAKLTLSNDAEFTTDAQQSVIFNAGGDPITYASTTNSNAVPAADVSVTIDAAFKNIAYVTLNNDIQVGKDAMDILLRLEANFKELNAGDVTLTVDEMNSSKLSVADPIKVAVIKEATSDDFKIVVADSEKKLGMDGGQLSKVEVKDFDANTTTLEFELPDYLSWANTTFAVSVDGAMKTATRNPSDFEKASITDSSLTNADSVLFQPEVKVDRRDSSMGDITLKVTATGGAKQTASEVVGQLVDFEAAMTAVEKGKKEIPSIYGGDDATIKVTIKGVKGTFSDNRAIDFTVKGADITTSSISGSATKLDGGIVTDEDDGEFTYYVNGSNEDELEFNLEISADYAQNGAVTLTAESRDFGTLECEIAKVTPAFTVEVAKITDIKKGESLATADVIIKEAKAGILGSDQFIVLNLNDKNRETLSFASDYKVEATNGLKVDEDIFNEEGGSKNALSTLVVEIESSSVKEAGVITISNVVVNVDGATVDGVKTIDVYVVEDRSYTYGSNDQYSGNVSKMKDAVEFIDRTEPDAEYAVDYVNVVKEYGATATTTVFVIGSKSYTVNGEMMTANEAPFIAGKGYTMLPVRALAESLGLTADWNSNTKTATFSNDSKVASVTMGASTMYVNGTPIPLNAKAEIKNGSTFIELRSLASAFGVELQWDAATKTVTIIG